MLFRSVVFVFDTREPLGIAGSTLYIGVMFVAYWLRDQIVLTIVGICLSLMAFGGHFASGETFDWVHIVNRALAVGGIWLAYAFVTALLQSDKNRQLSETNFRNVAEHSIQGLVVHDDWVPVFANQSFAEIFGYDNAAEIVALDNIDKLIDPADAVRLRKLRDQRRTGKEISNRMRWRGVRKDGSDVWVESVRNFVEWSGTRMTIIAVIDVTEETLLEEKHRSAESRLWSALNSMGQPFALYDSSDRLSLCNQNYRELFGSRAAQVEIGMTFREILDLAMAEGIYGQPEQNKAQFAEQRMAQIGRAHV